MGVKDAANNKIQKDARIVVDWGTTSFRAQLVVGDGSVLDHHESKRGIQFVEQDCFEQALMTEIGGWFDQYGALPVYALGMITSRNGWVEVPYVSCPAGPKALAVGAVRQRLKNGSWITFLAGVNDPAAYPFVDVMRGEETQMVGFGLDGGLAIVLPGTHSKWARANDGRIAHFQTFVTGEIYSLLTEHAFIAKSANDGGITAWEAFDRGVRTVIEGGRNADAMLAMLFSGRTGMLAGELAAGDIHGYLSGLLIALEFHQARQCGWHTPGDRIGVVGNDTLTTRYRRCAGAFDLLVADGPKDAARRGVLIISDLIAELNA